MVRITSGLLMLVVSAAVLSAAQEPLPGEQNLPATDISRESNNPAKAAIKAREAADKDKANLAGMTEAVARAQATGASDDELLVRKVETALRSDTRTAKLGVAVKLDEDKLVGLHGSVPSSASRIAVIAVATNAAGSARVKSYLSVTGK